RSRLTLPEEQSKVFLLFSCLQRMFLETYARWQWLVHWLPRLRALGTSHPVDTSVIGAFTADFNIAADLLRIGCPVWLVRPLREKQATPIHRIIPPLDETFHNRLPLRMSEFELDLADAEPPHRLLFSG
ncbi:hypothetical protein GYMLUDRAFT_108576, partial [Collybiopsis luxurians FD-317 M1]